MEEMLRFDTRTRIKASESLSHKYLSQYHDPTDEPVAAKMFNRPFDDSELTIDEWKFMMYSEIIDYHNRGIWAVEEINPLAATAMDDGLFLYAQGWA